MLISDDTIPDYENDEKLTWARAYLTAHFARNPVVKQPVVAPSQRIGLVEDAKTNGPWLISSYGENLALGFKGNADFIFRCYSWAVNTAVIGKGARLSWYYERITGRLAYVCPKDVAAVLAGLRLQFRAEIIAAREVTLLEDHTQNDDWEGDSEARIVYNEPAIESLAACRADAFMRDHVLRDSFVLDRLTSVAPIYSMGSLDRGQAEENA